MISKKNIHPEGPRISKIILGGWRWNDRAFTYQDQLQLIETAMENGITSFDHADIYGNYNCQYLFGNLLKKNPHLRDKIEIITKCGIKIVSNKYPHRLLPFYDTSKKHIIKSTEDSLSALHTDYIDMLLIHRPDPLMDADAVAEAFISLKKEGKVRYFGVSNFTKSQFKLLQSRLDFPLVTNQLEISINYSDLMFDGTLDLMQELHVGLMAWSPFGGGSIFNDRSKIAKIATIAKKYKVSNSALMIAWLLHHPANIFPVVGTTKPHRLLELVPGHEVKLDRQDWYLLLKVARGIDVP